MFYTMDLRFGLFILLASFTDAAHKDIIDMENMEMLLRTRLMNPLHYSPLVRPVKDVNKSVPITVDISLHHIVDLNEKLQYLQLQIWFRSYWIDEFIRWNSSDYNGLYQLQFNHYDVWTPDMEIYNEMGLESRNDRHMFPVTILHTGEANWRYPRSLLTGCSVNITNFPYDHQRCNLDVGSWTLDSRFANVTAHKPQADNSEYRTASEWRVVDIPANSYLVPYEAWEYGYHVVIFSIQLQRKTNYYIFHMVFPCILISLLNACSFLLPVSSGERISMSVTTLLGLVVFLLMIADLMPPTSGVTPIIDIYFGCCIAGVAWSVLLNVFIIHLHFRGSRGSRMPRWMRLVIYRLGRILRYGQLLDTVGFLADEEGKPTPKVGKNKECKKKEDKVKLTSFRQTSTDLDEVFCTEESSATGLAYDAVSTRTRRPSERFGHEDNDLTIMQQDRFEPMKVIQNSRRMSRATSHFCMDPILQAELQQPARKPTTVAQSISTEWKIAATVLDRLFFLLFVTFMSSLTILILPPKS